MPIINNLYTTLQDMAASNDEDLINFLRAHSSTRRLMKSTPRYSSPSGFDSFVVNNAPQPVTRDVAKDKIQEILKALDTGRSRGVYAINLINRYLTPEGSDAFCRFLLEKGGRNNAEIAEGFVSSVHDLQLYYKGMPPYSVEVEDLTGGKAQQGERYAVWLVDNNNGGSSIRLQLRNKEYMMLYLWFLLQPRIMIRKEEIKARFREFLKLSDWCYKENKSFEEKFESRYEEDGKKVSRTGFDRFFTASISKVNKIIRDSLPDEDTHGWYLIGQEPEGYSLSITKQFVSIPESLQKYAHYYLNDRLIRE